MIRSYLCAYGIRPVTTEAIARVLLAKSRLPGFCPVRFRGFRVIARQLPMAPVMPY